MTPQDRERAKVFNFGIPGGMSPATLLQKAKSSFGTDLTEQGIKTWSDEWHNTFPEIRQFLGDQGNKLAVEIVGLFDLDPMEISRLFGIDPPRINEQSVEIAGNTFLKALRVQEPKTGRGVPYRKDLLDYLWARLEAKKELLSPRSQENLGEILPSEFLCQEVRSLVDHAGVMTLTGRLRAKASYTARHNTIFQGLAADGAKLALWRLWREGFRIVNFIHDQFLIEIPRAGN